MARGRGAKDAVRYVTRTLDLPQELKIQLDELCRASGQLQSQVVTAYWRVVRRSAGRAPLSKRDPRRKVVFLSEAQLEAMFPKDPEGKLHSHSCDAVVQKFCSAIKSANARKKTDPNARYPKRRPRYAPVVFKSSAIRLRDGQLLLSTGDKKNPVAVDWPFPLPRIVEIGWKAGGGYELRATYEDHRVMQGPKLEVTETEPRVAGVDIGELRIAAVYDGRSIALHSGRAIRSRNHYAHKRTAKLDQKIDRKKKARKPGQKSSRRLKRLQKARLKLRERIRRQNQDQLRKQSRAVVSTLYVSGVQTVAIGDLSDIRTRMDFGSKANQKLHGWAFGFFVTALRSQCLKFGLDAVMVDEAYTSKTCPWTGTLLKKAPSGRVFRSPDGQHVMDRDGVGAVNIRRKYLETRQGQGTAYGRAPTLSWTPVLAGMAPVTRGVRFRGLGSPAASSAVRVSRAGLKKAIRAGLRGAL